MRRTLLCIISVFTVLALSGCHGNCNEPEDPTLDRVVIMYSCGMNNLASYLREDIATLTDGYLPRESDKKALVVVSHLAGSDYNYTPEPSYVFRAYRDSHDQTVCDTLMTLPPEMMLTSERALDTVCTFISKTFPSHSYGMIVSSHASGWLPNGYYDNPVGQFRMLDRSGAEDLRVGADIYARFLAPPAENEPLTKSIGPEAYNDEYVEMTIKEFASAIPFHLDFLLFDACLMGGIEAAYEFRDLCDFYVSSQTEVMADGFAYESIGEHLLRDGNPDLEAVCNDFYEQYINKTGIDKSATISLVDCRALGPLADVCRSLIEKYADRIATLDGDLVQRYYRSFHHWYYDLEDIFLQAGIDDSERILLGSVLSDCVLYKRATPQFWGNSGFDILHYSGLSSYLPSNGSAYLDDFYRTLDWNIAVSLVK